MYESFGSTSSNVRLPHVRLIESATKVTAFADKYAHGANARAQVLSACATDMHGGFYRPFVLNRALHDSMHKACLSRLRCALRAAVIETSADANDASYYMQVSGQKGF